MPLRIRDAANTLRTITRVKMRDAGGILRNIQRIRMRDAGGTLRTVFIGMSAVATSPANGTSASSPVTSLNSVVTVTGGVAPFTYIWDAIENSAGITIVSPSASATTFRKSMPSADTVNGTFQCTVVDALGTVVTTNYVLVELTRT